MRHSRTTQHSECSNGHGTRFLANLWQMALRAEGEDALCLVELRGFEPLTPCMPLTSQPLAPQHASTRCLISMLLSTQIAMKRHGAGCGDMRFGCWQIAGGSAIRALRSRCNRVTQSSGARVRQCRDLDGSLTATRRLSPLPFPRPRRRRVGPAVPVPAGGRLEPPRPTCGPAGRPAVGGPARRSGQPTS
jgi:hypothetical protein